MNDAAAAGAASMDRCRQRAPEADGAVDVGRGDVNAVATAAAGNETTWLGPASNELAEVGHVTDPVIRDVFRLQDCCSS